MALLRARHRKDGLEILVDDPYRPGGKHLRGEWIPGKQVRQFAFHDSDSSLTAVWVERYGTWTAENLARRRLATRIGRIEEETFIMDLRTVQERDLAVIRDAVDGLFKGGS